MASAASGLRLPASASCLGRHSRLAGRCPNNSSLFPPLAAVVVVASHIQRNYDLLFRNNGATAFVERSVAMKAPVGLLSGRAVCASRWRGFAPTSSAERDKRIFTGTKVKASGFCLMLYSSLCRGFLRRACFLGLRRGFLREGSGWTEASFRRDIASSKAPCRLSEGTPLSEKANRNL